MVTEPNERRNPPTGEEVKQAANLLRKQGWPGLLPLPANSKTPPPHGLTGEPGIDLTLDELRAGTATRFKTTEQKDVPFKIRWEGNIGLRLNRGGWDNTGQGTPNDDPPGGEVWVHPTAGFDLDCYNGPSLANLYDRCGQHADLMREFLPQCWVSTGRGRKGLPTGIYHFRLPEPGLKLIDPPHSVDFIQWFHRYAVVHPSQAYDDEAQRDYIWITPEGKETSQPPSPEDLLILPAELVQTLTQPASQPGTGTGGGNQRRTRPENWNPTDWIGQWKIGTTITSPQYIIVSSVAAALLRRMDEKEAVEWIIDNIWQAGHLPDEDTQRPWSRQDFQERVRRAAIYLETAEPTQNRPGNDEPADWENTRTATATGTANLPPRPEPPPAPDWSPGTPIPIGKRTATIEAVAAWQATQQPTKAALQDYALTHLWPALQQPAEGEDGTRFSKQTLTLKVSAAADRWKSALKDWQQQVKAAQPEEETADPLDYATHIRENLIVCPDIHDRLWRYNPDTGSYIEERTKAAVIKLIADKAEREDHLVNMGLISTVLTLLKADAYIISFENPELLAMLNGTLNLATGELLEHSPDHRLPTYIPVKFDPQAGYDDWQEFLNQVFPERQEHTLLQQFAGACLPDRTPPRGALFIHGDYASGKSVFLNILIAFLGLWNITAIEPQALKKDHLSAALRGKKANLVSDMSIEAMKDPSGWKQLTGEDPILFNPKHKDTELAFTTCPSGYALNQIPDTWDRTGAVAVRRFIVQTAGTIPPEQRNPKLTTQLTRNLSGIFNWAYQGYKDLTAAGWQWPLSQAQQAQQDKAVLLDNPLRRWAAEQTEWSEVEHLRTTEAIDEYLHWLIKEKLLDKPEERTIRKNDDTITIPGQPRLPKPERDRILKELDNIWEKRRRHSDGWKYPNRRITTYDRRTGTEPAQGRITEDDPEYDKF